MVNNVESEVKVKVTLEDKIFRNSLICALVSISSKYGLGVLERFELNEESFEGIAYYSLSPRKFKIYRTGVNKDHLAVSVNGRRMSMGMKI